MKFFASASLLISVASAAVIPTLSQVPGPQGVPAVPAVGSPALPAVPNAEDLKAKIPDATDATSKVPAVPSVDELKAKVAEVDALGLFKGLDLENLEKLITILSLSGIPLPVSTVPKVPEVPASAADLTEKAPKVPALPAEVEGATKSIPKVEKRVVGGVVNILKGLVSDVLPVVLEAQQVLTATKSSTEEFVAESKTVENVKAAKDAITTIQNLVRTAVKAIGVEVPSDKVPAVPAVPEVPATGEAPAPEGRQAVSDVKEIVARQEAAAATKASDEQTIASLVATLLLAVLALVKTIVDELGIVPILTSAIHLLTTILLGLIAVLTPIVTEIVKIVTGIIASVTTKVVPGVVTDVLGLLKIILQ